MTEWKSSAATENAQVVLLSLSEATHLASSLVSFDLLRCRTALVTRAADGILVSSPPKVEQVSLLHLVQELLIQHIIQAVIAVAFDRFVSVCAWIFCFLRSEHSYWVARPNALDHPLRRLAYLTVLSLCTAVPDLITLVLVVVMIP